MSTCVDIDWSAALAIQREALDLEPSELLRSARSLLDKAASWRLALALGELTLLMPVALHAVDGADVDVALRELGIPLSVAARVRRRCTMESKAFPDGRLPRGRDIEEALGSMTGSFLRDAESKLKNTEKGRHTQAPASRAAHGFLINHCCRAKSFRRALAEQPDKLAWLFPGCKRTEHQREVVLPLVLLAAGLAVSDRVLFTARSRAGDACRVSTRIAKVEESAAQLEWPLPHPWQLQQHLRARGVEMVGEGGLDDGSRKRLYSVLEKSPHELQCAAELRQRLKTSRGLVGALDLSLARSLSADLGDDADLVKFVLGCRPLPKRTRAVFVFPRRMCRREHSADKTTVQERLFSWLSSLPRVQAVTSWHNHSWKATITAKQHEQLRELYLPDTAHFVCFLKDLDGEPPWRSSTVEWLPEPGRWPKHLEEVTKRISSRVHFEAEDLRRVTEGEAVLKRRRVGATSPGAPFARRSVVVLFPFDPPKRLEEALCLALEDARVSVQSFERLRTKSLEKRLLRLAHAGTLLVRVTGGAYDAAWRASNCVHHVDVDGAPSLSSDEMLRRIEKVCRRFAKETALRVEVTDEEGPLCIGSVPCEGTKVHAETSEDLKEALFCCSRLAPALPLVLVWGRPLRKRKWTSRLGIVHSLDDEERLRAILRAENPPETTCEDSSCDDVDVSLASAFGGIFAALPDDWRRRMLGSVATAIGKTRSDNRLWEAPYFPRQDVLLNGEVYAASPALFDIVAAFHKSGSDPALFRKSLLDSLERKKGERALRGS